MRNHEFGQSAETKPWIALGNSPFEVHRLMSIQSADDEQPRPALRNKIHGIQNERVDAIAEPVQGTKRIREVGAAVRSHEPSHVFNQNYRWPTASHLAQNPVKAPKCP